MEIKRQDVREGDYGIFCDGSPTFWIQTIRCYEYKGFQDAYRHMLFIGLIRNGIFYYAYD